METCLLQATMFVCSCSERVQGGLKAAMMVSESLVDEPRQFEGSFIDRTSAHCSRAGVVWIFTTITTATLNIHDWH